MALRRIDWILVVHRVGEFDITIFVLALFGVHIVAAVDMRAFLLVMAGHNRSPFG